MMSDERADPRGGPPFAAGSRARCGLALAFALCALTMLALLANHPQGAAHGFAEVLAEEARNQVRDGLVHGGFIVTLGALIVCFVFLSRILGAARPAVLIALVAFCIGCGALMASMVLDGFATPAIAARFAGTDGAEPLASARTLFILLGTVIRFLMSMGLMFQAAAMLFWSSAIVGERGLRRGVGIFGFAAALALIVALLWAPAPAVTHVLLAGIVLLAAWYLGLAAVLLGRD